MQTNLRFDHALLAVEGEHDVHCMLELTAPTAPGVDRPPLHLALVIDRSGSMTGPKLAAARDCARFLAGRLQPTDELALISYDNEVQLLAPLAPVPDDFVTLLDAIRPGGATNLSGGWLKGLEELRRAAGDGPRRVLLLTDGQANEGVVDPARLRQIASRSKPEVATTTIGFGDGFDEDLLAAISDASGGNSYFAASPEDAPGIFSEEFEGLASLVAQNLSVEIRPSDAVEILGVLNDYPVTQVPGGLQVQIGDAYGGEVRRLVFALHIPHLAVLGAAKVADVVLRYVSVGEDLAAHEVTVPVVINLVSADEAATAELDAQVTDEIWLLRAARARKDAIESADAGDWDATSRTLRAACDDLRIAALSSSRADELLAEADMLDGECSVASQADPMWRKRVHQQARRRTRGRPTASRPSREVDPYE